MYFKSQFGQDEFIYKNYFNNINKGIYVDIGAYDGIIGSNTYVFDKLGWSGVCIEPNKVAFNKLINIRNSYNFNCAVSNYNGIGEFCVIDGYSEQLSGLTDCYCDEHKKRIDYELEQYKCNKRYINVPVKRFYDLLLDTEIKSIDYCSIDTEGSELIIINDIDFDYFDIKMITIENNYNDENIRRYMNSKQYSLINTFGEIDELYVKL